MRRYLCRISASHSSDVEGNFKVRRYGHGPHLPHHSFPHQISSTNLRIFIKHTLMYLLLNFSVHKVNLIEMNEKVVDLFLLNP